MSIFLTAMSFLFVWLCIYQVKQEPDRSVEWAVGACLFSLLAMGFMLS